ncbi:MAG TPA: hypothetical protein VFE35_03145 [Candidatus Cybelea sp.]|jgi:integrase|nr:hypothetical protein [Candidatus Cybelea sp.]
MPDRNPIRPWNFGAAFVDLVRRAGVTRIRLHDLRDTHASLSAKVGVRLRSSCGGSVTMDRYLVVYRDRDCAAADAFDRIVSGVC